MKNISPKYLSKISLLISILLILIVLVSCVPQQPLTDEELKAELAKLTPEERAQLLKDLDNKEGGAFAGQAIAKRYGVSPRVMQTPKARVQAAVKGLGVAVANEGGSAQAAPAACTDSDSGIKGDYAYESGDYSYKDNPFVKGTAKGYGLNFNSSYFENGTLDLLPKSYNDVCMVEVKLQEYPQEGTSVGVNNCNDLVPGSYYKSGDKNYKIQSVAGCFVSEMRCSLFTNVKFYDYNQDYKVVKSYPKYPLVTGSTIPCKKGCENGACFP